MDKEKLKNIEKLEKKYLEKYYHFLKFAEDELLFGFKTKQDIEEDWIGLYKSGISDFAVGAERIVYSLLNGKGIGQPNSCPVGADLFFEVQDAYIHLDLKTVGATLNPIKGNKKEGITAWSNNIGDYTNNIFVGTNQNSYKGQMIVNKGGTDEEFRDYTPALPTFYNKGTDKEKICLSYFVTILYDKDNLDILVMSIVCMPNGDLEPHYKTRVLQAGKLIDKTRFRFTDVPNFELLEGEQKRIKVVYFDKNMDENYLKKVKFFEKLYDNQ
jgi:hypothetical protein